jgi:hypothetical protein
MDLYSMFKVCEMNKGGALHKTKQLYYTLFLVRKKNYLPREMETRTNHWISQFWKPITDFFFPTFHFPLDDQVCLADCLSQVANECNGLIPHQASFPTDE